MSQGEVQRATVDVEGDDIILTLDALDERSQTFLVGDVSTESVDVDFAAVAEHLASSLEDFACETRLGWGQQRGAVYTVPD